MSNKKTLLLVEDEAIQSLVNQKALEDCGYNVITANSAIKAITIIETTADIDLILMDINLGKGMDGTEAAGIILKNHDIPALFLSSHVEPEFVNRTEKIENFGFVSKSSGITVLDTSIKLAFKLFDNKKNEKIMLWQADSVEDIILSVDREGIIKILNNAGHTILGYTTPELIGKNWIETCIPEELQNDSKQIFEQYKTDQSVHPKALTGTVITKNKKKLLISWHQAIHREKDGNLDCLLSSGIVISEQN